MLVSEIRSAINIPENEVTQILAKLNLSPKKSKLGIKCNVPTYRGDIKIEEDLVEEVARLYGYNNFPMTMPTGKVSELQIPYYFDDSQIIYIKNLLVSSGYSEAKNLSLISKDLINKFCMDTTKHIRVENPVSTEYEFMRSSLIPGLVSAIKINSTDKLKLFEIDKVFLKTGKGAAEKYKVAGIFVGDNFRQFKGALDLILSELNIAEYSIEFEVDKPYLHQSNSGTIKFGNSTIGEFGEVNPIVLGALEIPEKVYCFEMDIESLKKLSGIRMFTPVPLNPAQIEDVTLIFPPKTRIGDVIKTIKNIQPTISNVELIDIYKDAYTFRIWYQDNEKTLTNEEVEKIRDGILASVKTRFGATIKV